MIKEKRSKKGVFIAVACVVVLLAVIMALENALSGNSYLKYFTALKKVAVYALVACSMNLLNGFTGLFSLGQAGFMLLGAYTYAILTIPVAKKVGENNVYYQFGESAVKFSLPELFGGMNTPQGLIFGVLLALICAGIVAAVFAWLIGLPVLRLKSDYLAIATLGSAEILGAVFKWAPLGPITNGGTMLRDYPTLADFNIKNTQGVTVLRLSTTVAFLIAALCITLIVLLINSSYGRAFKAIREDEIAAEAMGINLAKHKRLAFCVSSFFAGVGGGLLAMFTSQTQAKSFTIALTYEILLIVVIGGIGSISGSCLASLLYIATSEVLLRDLDAGRFLSIESSWFRTGARMVVFSAIIMIVVLFFRRGIMGDKELPDLFKKRPKAAKAKSAKKGGEVDG